MITFRNHSPLSLTWIDCTVPYFGAFRFEGLKLKYSNLYDFPPKNLFPPPFQVINQETSYATSYVE